MICMPFHCQPRYGEEMYLNQIKFFMPNFNFKGMQNLFLFFTCTKKYFKKKQTKFQEKLEREREKCKNNLWCIPDLCLGCEMLEGSGLISFVMSRVESLGASEEGGLWYFRERSLLTTKLTQNTNLYAHERETNKISVNAKAFGRRFWRTLKKSLDKLGTFLPRTEQLVKWIFLIASFSHMVPWMANRSKQLEKVGSQVLAQFFVKNN